MLRNLTIKNYALIDELELEFGPGLTIITGETGAGKSIMLGALSLLMGGRAETRVIADTSRKSVVEATFTVRGDSRNNEELENFFAEKGIEWNVDDNGDAEIIVRREISSSGRSKVYVNDTSVTIQTLTAVSSRLIDIHSQNANRKINDPAMRLDIVDFIAGNSEERETYRELYGRYAELRRRIKSIREERARSEENAEFLRFQKEGLDKLAPKRGELAEIERRFDALSDADEIKGRLSALANLLGDSDAGAAGLVAEAVGIADKVDFSLFRTAGEEGDGASELKSRLSGVLIELRDLADTMEEVNAMVDTDPATLARLSDRMNAYYDAIKRYRVVEADELVDMHEEAARLLASIDGDDGQLPELEKEARKVARELKEAADRLTATRRAGGTQLAKMLVERAVPLGLPNLRFEAVIESGKLTQSGQDTVEFLCSFNKNGRLQPLQDVASGGETSRMMLSLKAIMAGKMNLPTIIFDEVDTGVSGEIADKMGAMMRRMGERMQVIVITHLPQVAAKGEAHFKVYKHDEAERTVTNVRRLSEEERVGEIAAMISGSAVTDAALEAARALLNMKTENGKD